MEVVRRTGSQRILENRASLCRARTDSYLISVFDLNTISVATAGSGMNIYTEHLLRISTPHFVSKQDVGFTMLAQETSILCDLAVSKYSIIMESPTALSRTATIVPQTRLLFALDA